MKLKKQQQESGGKLNQSEMGKKYYRHFQTPQNNNKHRKLITNIPNTSSDASNLY